MPRHFSRVMVAIATFVCPDKADPQTLSTYGTPGLIDMPTAEVLSDGHVALTANVFGDTQRNTFTFQMLPRLYGSFRYSIIRDFEDREHQSDRFDRSFDLHYQILDETRTRPSFGIGLRDFGGTGIYSSEYIVATKTFGPKISATGGLGWGRLAGRDVFDGFGTRPDVSGDTGQVDFGAWFRGPVGVFGGLEYQATDRLSFQIKYSSDTYDREVDNGVIDIDTPFNVGVNYNFAGGSSLRAFTIGGTEVGVQYSYTFDPARRRSPGGFEGGPRPVVPRNQAQCVPLILAAKGRRVRMAAE